MSDHTKKFITSCTLTFKAFDHTVVVSKNKSTMWNFTALNKRKGKTYAVYCAPRLGSAKVLIKLALKKVPKESRLIVVTTEFSEEERIQAEQDGYTLVTLALLSKYGTEMLEAKQMTGSKITAA